MIRSTVRVATAQSIHRRAGSKAASEASANDASESNYCCSLVPTPFLPGIGEEETVEASTKTPSIDEDAAETSALSLLTYTPRAILFGTGFGTRPWPEQFFNCGSPPGSHT
mgnify:CR=1 FL=1